MQSQLMYVEVGYIIFTQRCGSLTMQRFQKMEAVKNQQVEQDIVRLLKLTQKYLNYINHCARAREDKNIMLDRGNNAVKLLITSKCMNTK